MVRLGRALLVVCCLAAAACGNDDDNRREERGSAASRPSSSTASGASTPDGTSPGRPPGTGPSPTVVPGPTGGAQGDGSLPAPGTTSPPGPQRAAPRPGATADPAGRPGSYGAALLGRRTGDELILEVQQQAGADPEPGSIEHVQDILEIESGKSVRSARVTVAGSRRSWSDADIRAAAAASGRAIAGNGRVVLRLLFLRGSYARDDSVLGVAIRGDTAAVFPDQARAATPLGVGVGVVERAVATHEVGHLLGLVDLFLRTGRDDPAHPGHSRNERSVMYWAVESNLVGQVLEGGPPTEFDDADRADLARIRAEGS